MKKRKKIMWIFLSIFGVICLSISGVLIAASVVGQSIKNVVNTELEGVDEDIENALYMASLAPNSHNAQMWSIEINPSQKKIGVKVDDARTLSYVDSTNREAYISIGCYLGNLDVALTASGYETSISLFDEADSDGFIASVTYTKISDVVDKTVFETIKTRHTDKSAFKTDALNETQVTNAINGNSNVICYQSGCENFSYLKKGILDAVIMQSGDQAYRDEFAEWLRLSNDEALETQDGLPAEQIGLKGIVKAFYYWFTTKESATGDQFAKEGIATASKQLNGCSAFFVIKGNSSMKELVSAGIESEQFWLNCVTQGISIQPMSAILEVPEFANEIQEDLNLDKPVQMVLRAGVVNNYGTNNNIRRDLNDYVIVVND